jgi:hypothetical protein
MFEKIEFFIWELKLNLSFIWRLKRKLKAKIPVKLSNLCIDDIYKENSCGYGSCVYIDLEGEPILKFNGHYYEPIYEYFETTCAVYGYEDGNEICLYDKRDYSVAAYRHKEIVIGSKELVEEYVKQHGDVYVVKKEAV